MNIHYIDEVKKSLGDPTLELLKTIFEQSSGLPPCVPATRFRAKHPKWMDELNSMGHSGFLLKPDYTRDTYRVSAYVLPLIQSARAYKILACMEAVYKYLTHYYSQHLRQPISTAQLKEGVQIEAELLLESLSYMRDVDGWCSGLSNDFPLESDSTVIVNEQVLKYDTFGELISRVYKYNYINPKERVETWCLHDREENSKMMSNIRIPMAICATVADILSGSHATLDNLFLASGAPGPPPNLAHHSKWKTWLFRAGNDSCVDSLALLGNLIEEFMDLPPLPIGESDSNIPVVEYNKKRERLVNVLEEHGFRYFRGGRVLPNDQAQRNTVSEKLSATIKAEVRKPSTVEELLQTIVRGLPRSMHPLTHRRKGAVSLSFESEYDIQDLLHAQIRPWIADIRPEEFTPSYAGTSTRMDFLLPTHQLVIETKRVRDKSHANKIGDELIIDIEHYRRHPDCNRLWCVIYDQLQLIPNPSGLINDLEGQRSTPDGNVDIRIFILGG